MPHPKTNDEIDLVDLLLKLVLVLKANFLLIIIFFFVGLVLGGSYFFLSKKVYENTMIISSSILTTSFSQVLFDNATRHLEEGSYSVISSQFNISEADASKINSIKIGNVTKTEGEEVTESDRFRITVEITDQQILPQLQKGILNYLENNEFVKVRVDQRRNHLKQMLATVTQEINDLSEFKRSISSGDFFERTKGNVNFDPTTVNSKILDLTERKIEYENGLQLINSIQVIEGFTKFESVAKPKLSVSLASGSLVGLFFVAVLLAFKSVRKVLKMADTAK
jgi:hypothetical protein